MRAAGAHSVTVVGVASRGQPIVTRTRSRRELDKRSAAQRTRAKAWRRLVAMQS